MAKIEYDLNKLKPSVTVDYSGNPLDPAKVHIDKTLGSFGAIPPYFIFPKADIISSVDKPYEIIDRFSSYGLIHSQMPMRVRKEGTERWLTLPIEPLVSISGKNTIVRRNVAKSKQQGTVKERWSQDDYSVTIQGVISSSDESLYPAFQVQQLRWLFDEQKSIEVDQLALLVLGIRFLAIESFNLPHTKGLNNQNFEIKAYSDSNPELLIPLE